ncbi:MAG: hypothetical protein HKN11_20655 [Rhizobiales bacterium]|nr:hypothetical protein [Hyphomicrobiales bacterium]
MSSFSYDKSAGTMVFGSPNGEAFPVSTKAVAGNGLSATATDKLDGVMFTMRSEPTEHKSDKLDGVMFTMRSEPTEHQSDKLDGVMFTMRSEPTELGCRDANLPS